KVRGRKQQTTGLQDAVFERMEKSVGAFSSVVLCLKSNQCIHGGCASLAMGKDGADVAHCVCVCLCVVCVCVCVATEMPFAVRSSVCLGRRVRWAVTRWSSPR